MHLVIGATGRTGRAALSALLETGENVRAVLRDPKKINHLPHAPGLDFVFGDIRDMTVLAQSMQGIEVVYLSLSNGPTQEATETAIVDVAHAQGVRKIVKLSGPTAGPKSQIAIARMHGRIEARIRDLGFDHVFLRPYAFMQNLRNQLDPLVNAGTLFGSTADAKLNMIDARDVGAVAAHAMRNDQLTAAAVELTGSEAVTYAEVAARLTAMIGAPICYLNRLPEAYAAELRQQGLPEWTVEHILEIQALTRDMPEKPNNAVEALLGRAPLSLDAYLLELAQEIVTRRRAPGAGAIRRRAAAAG